MPKGKNKTRYVILGLLNDESLSGYEIKKIIDNRFSFFWSESFGQIYPQLKDLLDDGLKKSAGKSENSNRVKIKYTITDAGKKTLQEWLMKPVETEIIRYEILLKLYFSDLIPVSVMAEHIMEFETAHNKQMKMFDMFEKQLREDIDLHSNHEQVLLVLSFGQRVWQAYADWCKETRRSLDEIENKSEKLENLDYNK